MSRLMLSSSDCSASALIPGTSAYKYAQGKRLLQMNQSQAQTVDKLARQYGKILGFER